MFTNDKRQAERTGKYGTPRQDHLQQIVSQFQDPTQTLEIKLKLLSNLSNFSYDPYNFPFLRNLNVLELFLDHLSDPDHRLAEFAAAGICNAAADPANARFIVDCGGVPALVACLSSPVGGNTVMYAIASLFYLCECGGGVVEEVRKAEVVEVVERLAESGEGCVSVRNVARVLLDKYLRHGGC
ncbi:hypothetical protein RND81_03G097800 [Saponaria officinalis]|uniref:Armadillo repeat-containing protein 7 n=1 Tax=Saponaria officinalis TaxID=3572 RepID=A0AAW1M9C1_SAPOF